MAVSAGERGGVLLVVVFWQHKWPSATWSFFCQNMPEGQYQKATYDRRPLMTEGQYQKSVPPGLIHWLLLEEHLEELT